MPVSPPSGGFGAFGGLIMVFSMLMAMRKQPPGAAGKLIKAGAISPERALKPKTVGIVREHELDSSVRSGVAIELDDGRFWVDVPKLKRRRLRLAIVVFFATGLAVTGAWFGLHSIGLLP